MFENIRNRNRKTVIILSILTTLSLICCITLIVIAAHKPRSPEFCARCHSMESYYNTWKETVSCNTDCLNCHTHDNSGKTLSVEIEDSNCTSTDCHPVGKLTPDSSKYKEVFSFNHETHLKEYPTNLRLRCIGCHSYTGKEVQEGEKPKHFGIDENACFVCHFIKSETPLPRKIQQTVNFKPQKNGKVKDIIEENLVLKGRDIRGLLTANDKENIGECSVCHKDVQVKVMIYDKEFDHLRYEKELKVECSNCHFETIHGNANVEKKNCYYCHTKIPKEYEDTSRMHNDHVKEHKVPCSPCHNVILHKWGDEYTNNILPHRSKAFRPNDHLLVQSCRLNLKVSIQAKSLNQPRMLAEAGNTCHKLFGEEPYSLQRKVYAGNGGKGIGRSPDPMYLATVNCTACHRDKDKGVDPMVCNTCHEKGFDKIMAEQKEFITTKLNSLSEMLVESQRQGVSRLVIDEAQYNYDLIVKDGSYGVHNIKYVKDLINHSIQRLQLVPKLQLGNEVN